MRKRISLLLALAFCLSLLTTGALADEGTTSGSEDLPKQLFVGGDLVEGNTYYVNDNNGGITKVGASSEHYNVYYDANTDTLTLNNANLSSVDNQSGIIDSRYIDSLTIKLIGTNILDSSKEYGTYAADTIYVRDGNLTISGTGTDDSGKLDIKTPGDYADYPAGDLSDDLHAFESGITVESGNLTVNNKANVTILGSIYNTYLMRYGVYLSGEASTLTIDGATLNSTAGPGYISTGVFAHKVEINNSGELYAIGSYASGPESIGLDLPASYDYDSGDEPVVTEGGSLTISSGKFVASSSNVSREYGESYGIDCYKGNISISGDAEVSVSSGSAFNSYGIFVGDMDISGSAKVTVEASINEIVKQDNLGIVADSIDVNGGELNVKSGDAEDRTSAILLYDEGITINGATVIASAGEKTEDTGTFGTGSTGIDTANNSQIILNSGTIKASADRRAIFRDPVLDSNESYKWRLTEDGAYMSSDVVIGNAVINAKYYEITDGVAATVALNYSEYTLNAGETVSLNATLPEGYTVTSWSSTDESVAAVQNGLVTGVAQGTAFAIVTATDQNGNSAASACLISVPQTPIAPDPEPDPEPSVPSTPSEPQPEETPLAPEINESDNGSVSVSNETPSVGDSVVVTPQPDPGYVVGQVIITDADGNSVSMSRDFVNGTWMFEQPEEGVEITVVYKPSEPSYTDVREDEWYSEAVDYTYTNSLMEGVSTTEFDPNSEMTRSMIWAVLARVDCEVITGSQWAVNAGSWAVGNAVSDGSNPNDSVTREQLVVMLWRYAGEPTSTGDIGNFGDSASVSDWAEVAMAWAIENGIITGVEENTLEPQGTATRAQCAAILMRYVENILK